MMLVLNVVLITASFLLSCDAKFADTLSKCSIKDDKCMAALYQSSVQRIGKTGIPELNIPPIDPLILDNLSVTLMDALKITVNKGTVEGVSNCVFNRVHLEPDENIGTQETTCDLTIYGQVSVEGASPELNSLFGMTTVNGEGKAKVKLDKVHIHYEFPFFVHKKDDGETYIKVLYENIKHKFDIGKATFAVENVYVGKEDIGPALTSIMNENSKTVIETFAKYFVVKGLDLYYSLVKNFFETVPTSTYMIEDLTSYIK